MNHADYFVDLVDEHGKAIGQKIRRDIDKRHDLYHAVFVLMTTPQGELVLGGIVERADLPNIYAHKLGVTVGAIRRHNETAEQAAKRALRRELFIKRPLVRLLGEGAASLEGRAVYLTAYTTVGLPPMEYSTIDLEELKIVSTDQFEEDLAAGPGQFAPTLRHIWSLYGDQIRQGRI